MNTRLQPQRAVLEVQIEHQQDIVTVLDKAAAAARAAGQDLLIISGVDDTSSAGDISRAIDHIDAAGARPRRIAFVACMLPQYSAYHFAERYAEKYGIAAKVLVSVRDARAWLGLRAEAPPPRRPVAETRL